MQGLSFDEYKKLRANKQPEKIKLATGTYFEAVEAWKRAMSENLTFSLFPPPLPFTFFTPFPPSF